VRRQAFAGLIGGELAIALRGLRNNLVFGDQLIGLTRGRSTMMRSYASAQAPSGGSILRERHQGRGWVREPPPRIVIGNAPVDAGAPSCCVACSSCVRSSRGGECSEQGAGRRQLPQRDQQLAGEHDDHCLLGVPAAHAGPAQRSSPLEFASRSLSTGRDTDTGSTAAESRASWKVVPSRSASSRSFLIRRSAA
jgi:hypothetical protein